MANSKNIAGLVGPVIIVLILSETMNLHLWVTNIPANTYLNGILKEWVEKVKQYGSFWSVFRMDASGDKEVF